MENSTSSDWTLVIKPKSGWFKFHLGEIWKYRDLIKVFVKRDLLSQYKQTLLGPFWFFIQPVFTTIIFIIIFGKIAKLPTDGVPRVLFYLSGIVAWNYFADCFSKTSQTLVANAAIFGKVYFPRLIIPISSVISTLAKFGIQFLLMIGFLIYFISTGASVQPNKYILLIPFLLLLMALLGLGLGIIISSLTIKYRDLQFLVSFGVQLLMYVTPVVYPLSFLPDKFRMVVMLNPMTHIIETFKFAFLGVGTVHPLNLLYSVCFTAVVLFLGLVIFHRVEQTFIDTV